MHNHSTLVCAVLSNKVGREEETPPMTHTMKTHILDLLACLAAALAWTVVILLLGSW